MRFLWHRFLLAGGAALYPVLLVIDFIGHTVFGVHIGP